METVTWPRSELRGSTASTPTLLQIGAGTVPAAVIESSRGFDADAWAGGRLRARERGWLTRDDTLTRTGRLLHAEIESTTDLLATEVLEPLGTERVPELIAALEPAVTEVRESGAVPFPNPMGLPRR